MRRFIIAVVVFSLIIGSLVFVPYRISAGYTTFSVNKWSDVPQGAFLLRFEKNYVGVSLEDAPLYVAAEDGNNTVIYKIDGEGLEAVAVLTVQGTYNFFDFDPTYSGNIYVTKGAGSTGSGIDVYSSGQLLVTNDEASQIAGITHYKNYIIYVNPDGINFVRYVSGQWYKTTPVTLGSLMNTAWKDDGILAYGAGQIGWVENGQADGIDGFGDFYFEGLFKDDTGIYGVMKDLWATDRAIYKITDQGPEKIVDVGTDQVKGLFYLGNKWIVYKNSGLYVYDETGNGPQVIATDVVSPIFHNGSIWYIGIDGIYVISTAQPRTTVDVDVSFETGGSVEFKDLENWTGQLVITNNDTINVSIDCQADVGWLEPQQYTYDLLAAGESTTRSISALADVIRSSWPTSPSIYGGYTCALTWDGGSTSTQTKTVQIKLPQLQFSKVVSSIDVSGNTTQVKVLDISNTGNGLGSVSCNADKSWATVNVNDDSGGYIRSSGSVNISFDVDTMPGVGTVGVSCTWDGGTYSTTFDVTKSDTGQASFSIVNDTIPLSDILDGWVSVASVNVNGKVIPLSVSVDKDFIRVDAPSSVSNTAVIKVILDRNKIKLSDMTLPYVEFQLTVDYGDEHVTVPVKIEISRALKLYLPTNRLDQRYDLWTQIDGWQQLVSGDSAPFINPIYNRTYVPLRLVSEGLGLQVGWDGKKREITIESQRYRIVLSVKNVVKKQVKISGKSEVVYESTSRSAKIYNKIYGSSDTIEILPTVIWKSRSYVPVRFVAENVKSLVFWDGKTRTVYIYR